MNDDNRLNDEVLAKTLADAVMEMKDSPFAWFEHRGISKEAAMGLADFIAEVSTVPQTSALTGFIAGWSLHAGLLYEEHKGFA
jgi:hypothetical protein